MSASESLSQRQFSNYAVRPHPHFPRTLEARHSNSDRLLGSLTWEDSEEDAGKSTVEAVFVKPRYRRKGIATTLYDNARQARPGLQHSDVLSTEGKAWKEAVDRRGGDD